MSERENEQGQNSSRGKVYTGEGYDAGGKKPQRPTPRRAAGDANRRKRRSEVLREEEEKIKRRSEVLREEEEKIKRRSETLREEETKHEGGTVRIEEIKRGEGAIRIEIKPQGETAGRTETKAEKENPKHPKPESTKEQTKAKNYKRRSEILREEEEKRAGEITRLETVKSQDETAGHAEAKAEKQKPKQQKAESTKEQTKEKNYKRRSEILREEEEKRAGEVTRLETVKSQGETAGSAETKAEKQKPKQQKAESTKEQTKEKNYKRRSEILREEEERRAGQISRKDEKKLQGKAGRKEDEKTPGEIDRKENKGFQGEAGRKEDKRFQGEADRKEDKGFQSEAGRREDKGFQGEAGRKEDKRFQSGADRKEDKKSQGEAAGKKEKRTQGERVKNQETEKKKQNITEPIRQRPEWPREQTPEQQTGLAKHRNEKDKRTEQAREVQGKGRLRDMSVRKKLLWGLGGTAAVIYIAVAVYFGFHFYGGTTVYGIDCSRKTAAEVKEEIKTKLSAYTLNIQERENKSESITADQIDLQYEDDGSIEQLLKSQHSYIWPIMILLGRSQGSKVAFSYDIPLARKSIGNLACMDASHMVEPHDAYISPTDTGYEVAREVMGTTLDEARTQETILGALTDGKTQLSLEEGDCYINPTVFQDDETLQQDAAAMSKLASANITLDFGNEQEVVDASVIQKWITKMANGEYVIDDVGVTEYVESLAAKYDTFGLPVDFSTTIGTTVTLSGGDYGWCINQNATVIALLEALNEGYRGTMEPVYTYEGMSHENNGIGYTYVEICISRQEMWCYSNGELVVDTPVVTGNPNKGNGTPAGGVWAIDAKQRNAVLVGEDYRSPVDYWMPFNGNIGIHDLQTRAYFGDTIYLYAGSHGCVNTPYEAVQTIYDVVSVGTPVIVYE